MFPKMTWSYIFGTKIQHLRCDSQGLWSLWSLTKAMEQLHWNKKRLQWRLDSRLEWLRWSLEKTPVKSRESRKALKPESLKQVHCIGA